MINIYERLTFIFDKLNFLLFKTYNILVFVWNFRDTYLISITKSLINFIQFDNQFFHLTKLKLTNLKLL